MLSRAWIELGGPAWDVSHLSTPHVFKRPCKKVNLISLYEDIDIEIFHQREVESWKGLVV